MSAGSCWMTTLAPIFLAIASNRSIDSTVCTRSVLNGGTPRFCRAYQRRKRREPRVHAAHDVETSRNGRFEIREPGRRQHAAHRRDADNQAPGTARRSVTRRQPRHPNTHRRRREAPLAQHIIATPVAQAAGRLRVGGDARVTEVQQIGLSQLMHGGKDDGLVAARQCVRDRW